jgi:hypothetical protein
VLKVRDVIDGVFGTHQAPSAQTPKPTRQHLKTVSEPTDSPSH